MLFSEPLLKSVTLNTYLLFVNVADLTIKTFWSGNFTFSTVLNDLSSTRFKEHCGHIKLFNNVILVMNFKILVTFFALFSFSKTFKFKCFILFHLSFMEIVDR